ncbi:response regulator [Paramagnetospirillum kuznetsovii]|uniref:Response regulator n=1 Tax=Paramagnetospirillum kuznetsovii TaxID=2053833 RepID=A0A364P0D9_9PROT|nr:diguanylate cyclase [Paramagnetospirillum kuznetsovii]RAU22627.1 response regulator [Paramagnetospirillum kuznetsovii]
MIRLADVLIAHTDTTAAEAFASRLSHNGYHAVIAESLDQAIGAVRSGHLDLIIIGRTAMAPVAFADAFRSQPDCADIPIVFAATTVDAGMVQDALAAGIDDVITWTCDDVELFARLRPLVRLATMHAELDQRDLVARAMGVMAAPSAGQADAAHPSILVVGNDADGMAAIFQDIARIVSTQNLYDAEGLLEKQNFDAAILCAGGEGAAFLAFSSQVRNNPRLFNLPLVMVLEKPETMPAAYRHGVSRAIVRPIALDLFRASVMTLVRRQQLRWAIRSALVDSLKGPTKDDLTGLYGRDFLDRYLESRLNIALTHQRHLAVVFFAIPNIDGVRSQFGDDAAQHLTQQLGQWIAGLLRAEDVTAVYGKNEFCVVLPDTPLIEAEVVMHRIAGVLAYTDFAVREVYQPIKVWVQVGCTDARSGDTLDGLVARARAKMD